MDWRKLVMRNIRQCVYIARYLKQPLDHVMAWPQSDVDLFAMCAGDLVTQENKPPK